MNKIFAIVGREWKDYFGSAIAYVTLFLTISIFNIFFYLLIDQGGEASMREIFQVMEFMFVFLVPLLTMRTLAQERSTGTFEFLLTSPVSHTQIILGKYFGALSYVSLILVLTLPYWVILSVFSQPDHAAILTGYVGLGLELALFVAIGVLCSSLTRHQILAAVATYVVLFLLFFSVVVKEYFSDGMQEVVRLLSVWGHSENFIAGIFSTYDCVYFLSGIVFILILTRMSLALKS